MRGGVTMKKKRLLAMVLALSMMCSGSVWANNPYTLFTDETLNKQINKEFSALEEGKENIASNSEIFKATPAEIDEDDKEIGDKEVKEATPSNMEKKFFYEKIVDGYKISLKAEEKVFPDDVEVRIDRVETVDDTEIENILKNELSQAETLQTTVAFDISFWSQGEEIQPQDDQVEVTIQFPEKWKENSSQEIKVFHVEEQNEVEEMEVTSLTDQKATYLAREFSTYALAVLDIQYVEIASALELQNIMNNPDRREQVFKLTNDIDLQDIEWHGFDIGELDGNGHSIRNLFISGINCEKSEKEYADFVALFKQASKIKNIKFENVTIEGDFTGHNDTLNIGLVGSLFGEGIISDVEINGLNINVVVGSQEEIPTEINLGGLLAESGGTVQNIQIKQSDFSINLENGYIYAGGIVGGGSAGTTIQNAYFEGDIDITAARTLSEKFINKIYCGGIASVAKLNECMNSGNINILANNAMVIAGGVVGSNEVGTSASQLANSGNLDIERRIFSDADGGSASMSAFSVGGLVGIVSGREDIDSAPCLRDSYNAGDISINIYSDWFGYNKIGNVGNIFGEMNQYYGVENCYNAGKISASRYTENEEFEKDNIVGEATGQLLGYSDLDDLGEIINNFYYFSTYPIIGAVFGGNYNGSLGNSKYLNSDQNISQQSYAGFDFESIWKMGSEVYPYPIFQWQNEDSDLPDIEEPDETIGNFGWGELDNGQIGYYDENGDLLKNGRYKLYFLKKDNSFFEGYWYFDENGYVQSGIIDDHYYYDKHDEVFPFGMDIGQDIWKMIESGFSPSAVLGGYNNFTGTFVSDLSFWDYLFAANPTDGLEELIGAIPGLWFSYGSLITLDELSGQIKRNYMNDVTTNKKILEEIIEKKFSGDVEGLTETMPYKITKKGFDKLTENFSDEFTELLKRKREEYQNNPVGKWSDSFTEFMEKLDEDEKASYYGYVSNNSLQTIFQAAELGDEWSEVFMDYSEKIEFLESIKMAAENTGNHTALMMATQSLIDDYNNRFIYALADSVYTILEEANSWRTVITGNSELAILEWDFNEPLKDNVVNYVASEFLKNTKGLSVAVKGVELIQKLDGRGPAINAFVETQSLYDEAQMALENAEKQLLSENADSDDLLNYIHLFDFMRCISIIRYEKMKEFYLAAANKQAEKEIKIAYLEKEIDKLEKITITNSNDFRASVLLEQWKDSEQRYYFYRENQGSGQGNSDNEYVYLNDGWHWIDGKKYYFDSDGHPYMGLHEIPDIVSSGRFKTDINSCPQYYFSTGSGTPNNTDHYGAMQTGFVQIDQDQYYFYESGKMARGAWVQTEVGGIYYYFGDDGKLEKTSYLDPDETIGSVYKKGYQITKINCPVNVYVYNETGTIIASVINNQVSITEGADVEAFIDHNGQKVIQTPMNRKYDFKIIAQDDGSMDYSVTDYPTENGLSTYNKMDYRNIKLKKDDIYYGITQLSGNQNQKRTHLLVKDNQYVPVTEVQTSISLHEIQVDAEPGGYTEGDLYVVHGDFVKLRAYPDEGNQFMGWYDENGSLISQETEFRFRVLENEHLIAKFVLQEDSNEEDGDQDMPSNEHKGSSSGGLSFPIIVNAGVWRKDEKGWWYENADRTYPINTWKYLNYMNQDSWYHFDENGYMQVGWFKDFDGRWYYLNPISDGTCGSMVTGWKWIKGSDGKERCYYFESGSTGPKGAMYQSALTPDGYRVDENGAWIENGTVVTR